jgi:V8-like Glu-specific endopeptidase
MGAQLNRKTKKTARFARRLIGIICILTASAIPVGTMESGARLNNFERLSACEISGCNSRGRYLSSERLGGLQKLLQISSSYKLLKVNTFLENRPIQVLREEDLQYNPIGELDSLPLINNGKMEQRFGNAFLISPCLILTNHHVVFGDDIPARKDKDYRMKFRIGMAGQQAFSGNTFATPIIWGARDLEGHNDWAMLRLHACVGDRYGWFETDDQLDEKLKGKTIEVSWFTKDLGVMVRSAGVVLGLFQHNGDLLHCASTMFGASGAPIIFSKDGKLLVVGLNTGNAEGNLDGKQDYDRCDNHTANTFLNIRYVLKSPYVQKLIDEDKAAFGAPNPAMGWFNKPIRSPRRVEPRV